MVEKPMDEGREGGISRTVIAFNFVLYLVLILGIWALPTDRFVLVVTAPAGGADESLAVIGEAGGAFVQSGRFPWLTVAYSDERDFAYRLMKAGALIVLDHKLAVGCLKD
ncbi:hypothetical protein [Rhizobium halophytocola]|uniref:Uncharacterized protein n=1 Tax=Rhizobium halophytocola TaxID=735519 RepID=A0ABS4DYH6_9HYPH|nr:hypothetical protein [Rhizobium halophytocola]MBP1850737.1 hypothetical protein [Rhizobium halophytocola]